MQKTGRSAIDDSTSEWIIGSDEAGYGTWAGDLFVAGVAVRRDWNDPNVTDSKKLSDKARRAIVRQYKTQVFWVLSRTSPKKIDDLGVWAAVIRAHNEVHAKLAQSLPSSESALHVVDGLENARSLLRAEIEPLTRADRIVPAVALASCFAKVAQCVAMDRAHAEYPQYGFDTSRGYGTPAHQEALRSHGICPLHRQSYRPIRKVLEGRSSRSLTLDFEDDA